MLHKLSSIAGSSPAPLPPPPAYLKLPCGEITAAQRHLGGSPHAQKRSRSSGAQKAGLAYQRRVGEVLTVARPPSDLDCGPWFWYVDSSGRRSYCQPDFLLHLASGKLAVVEVKIRWTSDAWWQLRKLYLPVLQRVFPGRALLPLVICRSYDPSVRIAEEVSLIEGWEELSASSFSVMVLR